MIVCPECQYENNDRKTCIRCGCYLPPLLKEKDKPPVIQVTHKYHYQGRDLPPNHYKNFIPGKQG